jgi:adenylosuccinate lyase
MSDRAVMDISKEQSSVHPIDSRYIVKEMNTIWEQENYLQALLSVESALAQSISELNTRLISTEESTEIKNKAKTEYVKPQRVKEIESEIHHDVMAVVRGLAEQCEGSAKGKIHLGATSADITETANGLLMKQSLELVVKDARELQRKLVSRARETMDLVCIDRTHGQHAVPSTYGFIFAGYADQIGMALRKLEYDLENHVVGKIAGAVGTANTYKDLGLDALELENKTLNKLGIKAAVHSRQMPPRDNYSFIFSDITVLACTLEKIASDLWNLARTEIGEVYEDLGSSTMPHKKNPFRLERVMGMSSVIRGDLMTELELSFTHARDLKHSAADRYRLPEIFITIDYMLRMMSNIVENLKINEQRVQNNLMMTRGAVMAERVMTALAAAGVDRQEAHELIKTLAWQAMNENKMLVDLLLENATVTQHLEKEKIQQLMNPADYIGVAKEKTQRVIEKYE